MLAGQLCTDYISSSGVGAALARALLCWPTRYGTLTFISQTTAGNVLCVVFAIDARRVCLYLHDSLYDSNMSYLGYPTILCLVPSMGGL